MRFLIKTFLCSALVFALLTLLLSCSTSGVNQGDFNILSTEEEWQLGERLEQDLGKELQLVNDRAAVDYVTQVGQRIVQQTELAQLPWEFHIVRDPAVNAFNIPGGKVFVNTGLIEIAGNVSELAGVMAHEIAHGVARHGSEQLTKSYGLNILASLALGQNPSVYEGILAQVVGGGALAKFSRDAEREADSLGIRYMHQAGYAPEGMAGMFEKLLAQRQRQPGQVEQFFSTHPLTETRIAEVRRLAAELPESPNLIRRDPRFQEVQQRLAR
jgi:beta-barrel assembly-enhancing protease